MDQTDTVAPYIHAARNCTQMLHAIDRRLAKALECLEDGDLETSRTQLAMLKDALPQAISVIDHDKRMSKPAD